MARKQITKATAPATAPTTAGAPAQVVFLLDGSGSMGESGPAVVAGYNAFLDAVRGNVGLVEITLRRFTAKIHSILESVPIETAPTLKYGTDGYYVDGGNHILLSIMKTAADIEKRCGLDIPVAFVIQTDGGEGDGPGFARGGEYWQPVADLVKRNTPHGWTFILLYQGSDKAQGINVGKRMGLESRNVVAYDAREIAKTFRAAADLADRALIARKAPAGDAGPSLPYSTAALQKAYPHIIQFGLGPWY